MVALASLAVAALAAGAGYAVTSRGAAPVDTRPVVLPDTFAGWGPAEPTSQFADVDPQWRDALADSYGGHPFHGRAYGTAADRVRINLVVARGDFPDVGDAAFARPPYTSHGPVSCTHTLQLPATATDPEPQPVTSPGLLLCLRHDDVATVSAFVLLGAPREADVAAAVDAAWALQQ